MKTSACGKRDKPILPLANSTSVPFHNEDTPQPKGVHQLPKREPFRAVQRLQTIGGDILMEGHDPPHDDRTEGRMRLGLGANGLRFSTRASGTRSILETERPDPLHRDVARRPPQRRHESLWSRGDLVPLQGDPVTVRARSRKLVRLAPFAPSQTNKMPDHGPFHTSRFVPPCGRIPSWSIPRHRPAGPPGPQKRPRASAPAHRHDGKTPRAPHAGSNGYPNPPLHNQAKRSARQYQP